MSNAKRVYLLILTAIGWFAIIAQLVLHLQNAPVPLAESFIRFLSYFTVLTNILVILCFTLILFQPRGKLTAFFNRPSVQTAITLYITVVGLVYNLVLRNLWKSEGLQVLLHDLLHVLTPVATLVYWWIWTDARRLQWKDIPAWLIYPAVYAVYILIWGYFTHWYPYFFMNVETYGLPRVLLHSGLLVLVFIFFSSFFVFTGQKKRFGRQEKPAVSGQ